MVATRSKTAPQPGHDFLSHPSEDELITSFLRPRVASADWSCKLIHDADVYSAGPASLTNEFAPAIASNGDKAWYFFSAVRAKSRCGQRKARTVDTGEGCWHSEAGAKPVVEQPCRRLGHRQSFSFVTMVDGRRVRSGWLMVEVGIDDAEDMVLCKIYFSPRAHPAGRTAVALSAGRKRKAAVADKNPAPVPQRRRVRPTEEAVAEEKDNTQGGGLVGDNSVADDPEALWTDDSSFSRYMRNKDRVLAEADHVDRPDAELQADLGLGDFMRLLNSPGKDRYELPPPSPSSTVGDRGYPACLSLEELIAPSSRWCWFGG
ncbi:uncharacterized protein LOC133884589 [Phragmites australis]|uniref:uncharacterized protein LOC133884589 n=1 Tax=Phragmites australis TaxID=29695 RepID=UPI002D7946E0|nr:uncharacterized protein LOC133884589 [Phragmites australis]